MNLTGLICLAPLALVLPSLGFGSFMSAFGRVRGWNSRVTFWGSTLGYALFLIAWFAITVMVNNVARSDSLDLVTLALLTVFIIAGLIAPLGVLVLRSRHPAVFQKAVAPRPASPSNVPVSPSRDFVTPQPEPSVSQAASVKSGRIFISYRRSDSADITGRIYDRLIAKFGKEPIFKDVDSIPLGLDFKDYLDQKVGECDVLLAIIGDRWLEVNQTTGKTRLEDPSDFVRIEIQSALERGIPVIPLLVREAEMPGEKSLPAGLQKLVYRNGTPIRSDPDFHRDMDRLISALERYVK